MGFDPLIQGEDLLIDQSIFTFWSIPASELLQRLQTIPQGLTSDEVEQRLMRYGANLLRPKKKSDDPALLLGQFKSPVILILLFAAGLSFFLHDPADAVIIFVIVLVSGFLGFWQERGAVHAVEKLLAIVQIKATVIRDGDSKEVPLEEIVPGDIILLRAGDVIPGDYFTGSDCDSLHRCSRNS